MPTLHSLSADMVYETMVYELKEPRFITHIHLDGSLLCIVSTALSPSFPKSPLSPHIKTSGVSPIGLEDGGEWSMQWGQHFSFWH